MGLLKDSATNVENKVCISKEDLELLKIEKAKTEKVCCVENCQNIGRWDNGSLNFYLSKKMCNKHYERFSNTGDVNSVKRVQGENRMKNPLYSIYKGIKTRCYNKKSTNYKDYGGRGIVMSDEWLNDFTQFEHDMGERPSLNHSVERRKVNESYNKDNCFWALIHTQSANKRNNNKTVGVSFDKKYNRWVAYLEIDSKSYRKYFTTERAACVYRLFLEIKYLGKPIKSLE